MDANQVAQLAYKAGWRGSALVEAIAYAGIESSFNPDARSPTGCCGLWQLCPCVSTDPQTNANAAFAKWKAAGNTFARDWTPYDAGSANPQWTRYYNQAVGVVGADGNNHTFGVTIPNPLPILNPIPSIIGAGNAAANAGQQTRNSILDPLSGVLQTAFSGFEGAAARIFLTSAGVLIAMVGIVLLLFGDFQGVLRDAEEASIAA